MRNLAIEQQFFESVTSDCLQQLFVWLSRVLLPVGYVNAALKHFVSPLLCTNNQTYN